MIVLTLFLLLSAGARAQNQGATKQGDAGFAVAAGFAAAPEAAAPPMTLREFALQRIGALEDYAKSRPAEDGGFTYAAPVAPSFSFKVSNGPVQSFTVHRDGKIDLHGLTLEDAFLALYSNEVDRQLEELRRFDAAEKERELSRKSVPPKSFRLGKKRWSMSNQPDWSGGTVLGDTNCDLARVRILDADPDKRGTVMHELMHVASGCRDDPGLHDLIYRLAPNLVRLLRENPDVAAYLTGAPTAAAAHLVLDPVQAKYPGNEHVKACAADSRETCYEPNMPHITNRLYSKKETCEINEGVNCAALDAYWLPIGKPVFIDESEPK
jgi:hypothetical protein